jgi:hypothetical protein
MYNISFKNSGISEVQFLELMRLQASSQREKIGGFLEP